MRAAQMQKSADEDSGCRFRHHNGRVSSGPFRILMLLFSLAVPLQRGGQLICRLPRVSIRLTFVAPAACNGLSG